MALKTEKLRDLQVKLEKITVYACSMCNKCFVSENEFNQHLEIHTACLKVVSQSMYNHMTSASVTIERIKSFDCEKCPMTFKNKQDYFLHAVTHLTYIDLNPNDGGYVKKYKCSECDLMFVAESTLKAHGIVHDPIPHACSFCSVAFYQLTDLKTHLNVVHEEERKELENQLKREKLEKSKVRQLIESQNKPKSTNSGKRKSKKKQRKKCYWRVFSKEGEFKCPLCEEVFLSRKLIYEHISKSHKSPSVNPCNNCHAVYLTASSYEKHLDKCLNGHKFICDYCSKGFKSKYALITHMRRHIGGIPCPKCDKAYTQSHNLKCHLQTAHGIGDGVQYQCDQCEKKFSRKSYLVRHKYIHSSVKRYECEFCGKTFNDGSAKMRHVRLHTNERRYSCKYCDKTFTDNSQYLVHTLRHENRKNHKCEICNNKYYTLGDLKLHVLRHTDIKNYECDYCGKRFQGKSNLGSHIYRLHLKLPLCTICFKKFKTKSKLKEHKKIGCNRKSRYRVPQFLPVEE